MNKSAYRTISREWRASFSTLHPKTKTFIEESKLDTPEEVGLSKLMRTIRNLFVPPEMKLMIHKLINNTLYMGEVANKYQRLIKRVPVDSNILTSPVCLFSTYRFSQGYTPKYHKLYFTPDEAIATYEWVLWKSPIVTILWQECKQVLSKVEITLHANSYQDVIIALNEDLDEDDELNKLSAIIKQNRGGVRWKFFS